MTESEIIARIERLQSILKDDPYLGKRFKNFDDLLAARDQSRYRRVTAILQCAHLKQLLSRKKAAEILVLAPSASDMQAVTEALKDLQVDFQHTETFRERLALLTDALEASAQT
jgi:hypothetical protein